MREETFKRLGFLIWKSVTLPVCLGFSTGEEPIVKLPGKQGTCSTTLCIFILEETLELGENHKARLPKSIYFEY